MALPLWVVMKVSLKVGCTVAGKVAAKALVGPLSKALLGSQVKHTAALAARVVTKMGLEKGVARLLGANSLFVNRGPFDYTTWTHEEWLAATVAVEMAEAKGPGARAKFAAFRMLSPTLRMRLQRLRKDKDQDGSILVPGLRSKLWSLFEAMPVCPDFTRQHPHAVNDIMTSYLKHQSERRGLRSKWERYRWRKLVRAIDKLENYEFVELMQILHRWQTPDLYAHLCTADKLVRNLKSKDRRSDMLKQAVTVHTSIHISVYTNSTSQNQEPKTRH